MKPYATALASLATIGTLAVLFPNSGGDTRATGGIEAGSFIGDAVFLAAIAIALLGSLQIGAGVKSSLAVAALAGAIFGIAAEIAYTGGTFFDRATEIRGAQWGNLYYQTTWGDVIEVFALNAILAAPLGALLCIGGNLLAGGRSPLLPDFEGGHSAAREGTT